MTAHNTSDERHASPESFDRFLNSGTRVVLPVKGTPEVHIFVDPAKGELGLRVAARGNAGAPETGLSNVAARIATRDGKRLFEVVVTDAALFRDAYPFLCSMADRIQIRGYSPAAALRATLEKMKSLLSAPDSMSREREVGLFGELLVLGGLVGQLGAEDAVRAWRGGLAEEHDFGLRDTDIEVKATTSERRVHWIESLTQLVPTMSRPLWLISHQLTVAAAGNGLTLPNLVDVVRAQVDSTAAASGFENGLSGAGWRDEYRERLATRWTRRTASVAYHVTGSFPRLTPESLEHCGVSLDRVSEVRYQVDLSRLDASPDTPAIVENSLSFEGRT